MASKIETTKPTTKGKDISVDSDEVLDRFKGNSEEFFNKNKKVILTVGGVILLAVAGFLGYRYYQDENNATAQSNMFLSEMAWEKDSLKLALDGNAKKDIVGLNEIADEYSGTKAGNLASFYTGIALLKQGKYQDAIDRLKEFKSGDLLVQGIAYCRIGDAYLELKDLENAEDYYAKASNYKPNASFTPTYLIKLGLVQELQKKYDKASDSYNRIIEQYPTSRVATDAKKYKAKVDMLNSSEEKK